MSTIHSKTVNEILDEIAADVTWSLPNGSTTQHKIRRAFEVATEEQLDALLWAKRRARWETESNKPFKP